MKEALLKVEAQINGPIEKVWLYWIEPTHIMKWNNASDDWHTTKAENDLRVSGKFLSRMEAKDGSFGFDFCGVYDEVIKNERIAYVMEDGRIAKIDFKSNGTTTNVVEYFEAETENSHELQLAGWQSILDNFKKYVEAN